MKKVITQVKQGEKEEDNFFSCTSASVSIKKLAFICQCFSFPFFFFFYLISTNGRHSGLTASITSCFLLLLFFFFIFEYTKMMRSVFFFFIIPFTSFCTFYFVCVCVFVCVFSLPPFSFFFCP